MYADVTLWLLLMLAVTLLAETVIQLNTVVPALPQMHFLPVQPDFSSPAPPDTVFAPTIYAGDIQLLHMQRPGSVFTHFCHQNAGADLASLLHCEVRGLVRMPVGPSHHGRTQQQTR